MHSTRTATKAFRWLILLACVLFLFGIAAVLVWHVDGTGGDGTIERTQGLNDPSTLPPTTEPRGP